MRHQMKISAEISETIEKVDNLIKVTEDIYYARVYAAALKILRSGQWSESVSRKIDVIREKLLDAFGRGQDPALELSSNG